MLGRQVARLEPDRLQLTGFNVGRVTARALIAVGNHIGKRLFATVIPHLSISEVPALKAAGVVDKGMIPKVDSAVSALKSGIEKVSFVDGRVPHSVLLEIFTDAGVGTEVVLQ